MQSLTPGANRKFNAPLGPQSPLCRQIGTQLGQTSRSENPGVGYFLTHTHTELEYLL